MASGDKKTTLIRVSVEAKAILDKGEGSTATQIDKLLSINKKKVSAKIYQNPQTHLLDHAILLILVQYERENQKKKDKLPIWKVFIEGGTEYYIRQSVNGYFNDNGQHVVTWADTYPDFFQDINLDKAKTTFGISIHNRLKSLDTMGIIEHSNDGKLARWKVKKEYLRGDGFKLLDSYITECWRTVPSKANTVNKLDIKTYAPNVFSNEPFDWAAADTRELSERIMGLMIKQMEQANLLVKTEGLPKGEKIDLVPLQDKELLKYGIVSEYANIVINSDDTTSKGGPKISAKTSIVTKDEDGNEIDEKLINKYP